MNCLKILVFLILLQACGEKPQVPKKVEPNFEQSQSLFDELDKEMEKN
jgi:hypothetical protein